MNPRLLAPARPANDGARAGRNAHRHDDGIAMITPLRGSLYVGVAERWNFLGVSL
jgi:hypothetical protein